MRKLVKFIAAVSAMAILTAVPVMADTPADYTGWGIDGGAPRFYQNGALVTNAWLKYGPVVYYAGDKGYLITNRVMSEDVLKQFPVTYIEAGGTPVQLEVGRALGSIAAQAAAARIIEGELG